MDTEGTSYVQACITTVGFPYTLAAVEAMAAKHAPFYDTDMDGLLERPDREGGGWTAARWMTVDDILFFYHSTRARMLTKKLCKEAKVGTDTQRWMIDLLQRAVVVAEKYSGTIFGCARVVGPTHLDTSYPYHFDSRHFAPFTRFDLFAHPLPLGAFRRYRKISQSTVTPLYGTEFAGIKALLAETNKLPTYLCNARPNDHGFQSIDSSNWKSIACRPEARFIDETQVRTYFLDYLLSALKDRGSALLEECHCYRDGRVTGTADYFISLGGHWISVEAKLNVHTETDLLGQTKKYIEIDRIKPTKGASRDKSQLVERRSVCLVADQAGIYVVRNGMFHACGVDVPLVLRVRLGELSIEALRTTLIQLIDEA